jgi:Acetyltransferase (GNAT) family
MVLVVSRPIRELWFVARRLGLAGGVSVAVRRGWSTSHSLGLRADTTALPVRPRAKVDVAMTPVPSSDLNMFIRTNPTDADDARELVRRQHLCVGGVRTLYAAYSADGTPMYVQWLVRGDEYAALRRVSRGQFQPFPPDVALVEAAYTFPAFRGLGIMGDGMWQLLNVARTGNAKAVVTYVSPDNVPSLRACRRVGFDLDHVRRVSHRLGRFQHEVRPPDTQARSVWAEATQGI